MGEGIRSWLLRLVDEAFEKRAWHGPNLLGSIRGLSAEDAAWRPAPGRHSAWEIVLHCTYWKHRVLDRVTADRAGPFAYAGRDWPKAPAGDGSKEWAATREVLRDTHARLRTVVVSLAPAELGRPGPGQKRTRLENVVGVATHDIYHAGQIRLLRRLREGGS